MTKNKNLSVIDYDDLQSKTMDWLRFPLMVLIVFIHTAQPNVQISENLKVYNIYYAISQVLCRIAVPLFFVISGYYFFYSKTGNPTFNKQIYISKIKKRFHSLFLPYMIWNCLGFALLLVSQTLLPFDLFSDKYKMIVDYSLIDYINVFSGITTKYPIVNPLWFLRDLIIIIIFSPLLFFLIKKMNFLFIILLLPIYFSSIDISFKISVLFFAIGSFFAIKNINMIQCIRKLKSFPIMLYIVNFILILIYKDSSIENYLDKTAIILGDISALYLTSFIVQNKSSNVNKQLISISFFMYLWHGLFTHTFGKILCKLYPNSALFYLFVFFFSVFVTILLSFIGYKLLKRYFPKFTSIITGGR